MTNKKDRASKESKSVPAFNAESRKSSVTAMRLIVGAGLGIMVVSWLLKPNKSSQVSHQASRGGRSPFRYIEQL